MILDGSERRLKIIELLSAQSTPLSGTDLARHFGVSRQVIVQDVALLRAENNNIISTNKGYLLFKPHIDDDFYKEVILVKHTKDQILDEMATIVALGGKMLDVSIEHKLYGHIRSDLIINNLTDARDFVRKSNSSTSKPLSALTEDYHYHTIAAPSKKAMELIKADLREKGYLIE